MTCLESVQKKIDFKPEVALILGSGLGDFADGIKIEQTIDYTDIEGFPVSTVKGHKGRFCIWLCRRNSSCDHAGKSSLL